MKSCRIYVGSALVSFCLPFGGARAQIITEFSEGISAGAQPYVIAVGSDGNLWFTEFNGGNQIGRITPLGVVTEFAIGITPGAHPYGIAAGPDGNLWFTEQSTNFDINQIGQITPAGVITEFAVKPLGGLSRPATAPVFVAVACQLRH